MSDTECRSEDFRVCRMIGRQSYDYFFSCDRLLIPIPSAPEEHSIDISFEKHDRNLYERSYILMDAARGSRSSSGLCPTAALTSSAISTKIEAAS